MRAAVTFMPDADETHAGIFERSQPEGSFIGDLRFILLYYYAGLPRWVGREATGRAGPGNSQSLESHMQMGT